MADARIVCPICTAISSRTQLDIVAYWLACQRTRVDSRMSTFYIFFPSFFLFSPCNVKLLHTSNMESNKRKEIHYSTFYIESSSNCVGVRLHLALLKDNKSGGPRFFFLFSKLSNGSS